MKGIWTYTVIGIGGIILYNIFMSSQAEAGWFNYGRDASKRKPTTQGG